jgi:putative toxin-antitoxin system antitoxin component (TIGR02293 family)
MAVPIADVLELLGGQDVIRSDVSSELDLANAVEQGLPTAAIKSIVEHGVLTAAEVEQLVLPRRTLAHRRKQRVPLSPEESDRLARIARIVAIAGETFQSAEKASQWLRRSNRALGGRVPLELLVTSTGTRLVEDILGRIATGVYS